METLCKTKTLKTNDTVFHSRVDFIVVASDTNSNGILKRYGIFLKEFNASSYVLTEELLEV